MLPLISNCYDYTTTTLVTYARANWKHPRKLRRFPTRSGSLFSLKISTIAEHTKNENNFAFFLITKNNVWMHWEPQRWFCTLEEPAWCSLAKHLSSFSFFFSFSLYFFFDLQITMSIPEKRATSRRSLNPPTKYRYIWSSSFIQTIFKDIVFFEVFLKQDHLISRTIRFLLMKSMERKMYFDIKKANCLEKRTWNNSIGILQSIVSMLNTRLVK